MSSGYIKLHRSLLTHPIMANADLLKFWLWCLMRANHKQADVLVGYTTVRLQPGQFIFGRNSAAAQTGYSPQNIRTFVRTLEKLENLTKESTKTYTVLTVCNWDTYQSPGGAANQEANQEPTKCQPSANQEPTTDKNDKKVKNEKNEEKNTHKHVNLMEWWNWLAKSNGLKPIQRMTPARRTSINARISEGMLEHIPKISALVPGSKFLLGKVPPSQGHRQFELTFDWLTKNGTNWVNIVEGKYNQGDSNGSHGLYSESLPFTPDPSVANQ